ncbi:MAG: FAD-dependent monooxygenase [Gemmatimonadota bacterium]
MTDHAVVIAGGGPSGLMLAAELALAGVDVAIIERRPDQTLAGSRAGGLHTRTLEVLDQRGIVDRFLAEGQAVPIAQFAGVSLDMSTLPTRHPYTLGLWQNHIERILADWVAQLPVTMYRSREVVGLTQDDGGVDVLLSDGAALRTRYLVGCDGGRSVVRKLTGIEFPGWDATTSNLIAEVEFTDSAEWGLRHDDIGMHALGRVDYTVRDGAVVWADSGPVRVMLTERTLGGTADPSEDDLRAALIDVYGTDFGMHNPTWISRFTDMTRQAASYRNRRVLLCGDAAHIHGPDGGQGLQLGVQDAVNLGWKLAQVVSGRSFEALLDTYHAERHPVAAAVLRGTMARVALRRPDARTTALRDLIAELLGADEARTRLMAQMLQLDIRYDFGEGHPLLGCRMPDLDLLTDDGARRVYTLLHAARPVLLNFGARESIDITPWADRVRLVHARHDGEWRLPVVGVIEAPLAVLVRPDGHVAWVGTGTDDGLVDALTRWFGAPTAPEERRAPGATQSRAAM